MCYNLDGDSMFVKPIIGIVGRSDVATEDYNVICCYESIRKSVIKSGGIPILILPNQDVEYELEKPKDMNRLTMEEKENLKKVIDLCDGILMPGTYKLFEYDRVIYNYALEKDMPILGICGGMQLMGINDKTSEEIKEILIKNNTSLSHFKKGEKYVHKVNIQKNTLLEKILNKNEIIVNSRHNLHLDKADNLVVSGYSEDGFIEAVEVPNKKFVIGIQWHPESMIEYDEAAKKIFSAFIESCKI